MSRNDLSISESKNTVKIFLGIDGGGTKTNVSMLDCSYNLLFSETFGPSNLLNGTEFDDNILLLFKSLTAVLKEKFPIDPIDLYIISGFAGISTQEDSVKRFKDIIKRGTIGHKVNVVHLDIMSDALLALKVYFPEKPGMLLISGTGSICYGKNRSGDIFNTGGLGYMIDDGGSGYWFGKQALRLAMNSKFHFNEKSVIEEMVFEFFRVKRPEELYDIVYKENGKNAVASAAPLLFEAFDKGCVIAENAIIQGVEELEYLVRNCSKLINGDAPYVVLHGSVFKQQLVIDLLKEKLLDEMNIYKSDKRIDLEAATMLLDSIKTTNP